MHKASAALLLSIVATLFCPSRAAESYYFHSINMDDGLSHTDVTCFAQSPSGLLWIGTYAGLQSYDGYRLRSYRYYRPEDRYRLSHERITSLAASSENLWVGTESGLLCYNFEQGSFCEIEFDGDLAFLQNTFIKQLYISKENVLWVIAEDELYPLRIDEGRRGLSKYGIQNDLLKGKRAVRSFLEAGGYVWILYPGSLRQLKVSGTEISFIRDYQVIRLFGDSGIINCASARDDEIYFRLRDGVIRFHISPDGLLENPESCVFAGRYGESGGGSSGKMVIAPDNSIWCSSDIGLLHVPFKQGESSVSVYAESVNSNYSVNSNFISCFFLDSYDNLWIGTWGYGLNYLSTHAGSFNAVTELDVPDWSQYGAFIKSIECAGNGSIWALNQRTGLSEFNENGVFVRSIDLQQYVGPGAVYKSIKLDKTGSKIYIGLMNGLLLYNLDDGGCTRVVSSGNNALLNKSIDVTRMVYDAAGNLWVSTWNDGIYCFKEEHRSLSLVTHLAGGIDIPSDCVPFLYYDSDKDEVLACTRKGLARIILGTDGDGINRILEYCADSGRQNSLSEDFMACIDKQDDSTYWIGTIGGGLNRIAFLSDSANEYDAQSFMVQDGMLSNDAEIVVVDGDNKVWVGGYAVSVLDPSTGKISRYDRLDGLHGNYFKYGAGAKGDDGTIYMGGIGGFSYFNPKSVGLTEEDNDLFLSSLSIHDKPVEPSLQYDGRVVLPKDLNYMDKITLGYKMNDFKISFSVLGYKMSNRIIYRYRMLGFEQGWKTALVEENSATYSNLRYKTHTFELQYSSDGGQSWHPETKRLKIEILPPWWRSTPAIIAYILLLLTIVASFFAFYIRELNMRHKVSLAEIEKQNEEEKHQIKLQLFTNISHEFKTPLTLILTSLETVKSRLYAEDDPPVELQRLFDSVDRNSNRLLNLITELLDFHKTDGEGAGLSLENIDVCRYVRQITGEFSSWAEQRGIKMVMDLPGQLMMSVDPEKFSMILLNLISNAVKYTPSGGDILVSVSASADGHFTPAFPHVYKVGDLEAGNEICVLRVRDSGVGITEGSIGKIYDRYYLVREKTSKHLGSGLGLATAKNLVLQHGGSITVSSERMTGTEFVVLFPIRPATTETRSEPVFDVDHWLQSSPLTNELSANNDEQTVLPANSTEKREDLQTVLIVDDNEELLFLMYEHFKDNYNVLTALNGKDGLDLCLECYPDLVISDVMMPVMDGVALCKAIRDNLQIAYMSIILLTAKSDVASQIEGFEAGADYYLPKPFSMRILDLNVKRLLAYKKGLMSSHKEKPATRGEVLKSQDQAMLDKLNQYLRDNISDSEMSVKNLCTELGLGRTRLYAFVKKVTGMSLGDYIREQRLQRASELLKHSGMNITEVLYDSGFSSNSYFSKIFKSRFGMSPSDFIKESEE